MYAVLKKIALFLLLLLVISCKENSKRSCSFYILEIKQNRNEIDLSLKLNRKTCKGVSIDLHSTDKHHSFFANISNKLLNGAQPFGFSAYSTNNRPISLGVDKNIRQINIDGVTLLENSRIESAPEGMLIKFKLKIAYPIASIDIHPYRGKPKKIYLKRYNECKQVYLSLISTPDIFEKPQKNYTTPTLNSFMGVCLTQKSKKDKKRLLVKTFHIEKWMVESLKQSGEMILANFLKRKIKHKKIKPGKQCSVTVKLINAVTLKPVKSKRIQIIFKKISSEPSELVTNRLKMNVSKGVYVIKAVSNRFHGESKPINCRGGYIYVFIPLWPSI